MNLAAIRNLLLAEGLFLGGLGLGVVGSMHFESHPMIPWILLAACFCTTSLGFLAHVALLKKHDKNSQFNNKAQVHRPIDLQDAFSTELRHGVPSLVIDKPALRTQSLVMDRPRIFELESGYVYLFEHWSGPGLDMEFKGPVLGDARTLVSGELMRAQGPVAVVFSPQDGFDSAVAKLIVHKLPLS